MSRDVSAPLSSANHRAALAPQRASHTAALGKSLQGRERPLLGSQIEERRRERNGGGRSQPVAASSRRRQRERRSQKALWPRWSGRRRRGAPQGPRSPRRRSVGAGGGGWRGLARCGPRFRQLFPLAPLQQQRQRFALTSGASIASSKHHAYMHGHHFHTALRGRLPQPAGAPLLPLCWACWAAPARYRRGGACCNWGVLGSRRAVGRDDVRSPIVAGIAPRRPCVDGGPRQEAGPRRRASRRRLACAPLATRSVARRGTRGNRPGMELTPPKRADPRMRSLSNCRSGSGSDTGCQQWAYVPTMHHSEL